MSGRIRTIAVIATKQSVSETSDQGRRAVQAGQIVAELKCNLLTGGGPGAMKLVARSFCNTPGRLGRSIAIIPGKVEGLGGKNLGKVSKLILTPKEGYPNEFVEMPIFTHLLGDDDPKGPNSRNLLNVASADVILALKGNNGTQAELELGLGLGKPVIAFIGASETIGTYTIAKLPGSVRCVHDGKELHAVLNDQLSCLV